MKKLVFAVLMAFWSAAFAGAGSYKVEFSKVIMTTLDGTKMLIQCGEKNTGMMYKTEWYNQSGGAEYYAAVCRDKGMLTKAEWVVFSFGAGDGKTTREEHFFGGKCRYSDDKWKCEQLLPIKASEVEYDEQDVRLDDDAEKLTKFSK
ncbi:MAG: hypothetical protein NC548_55640 [Lachnospiraceae bacterium]|nr:hypothetical protein [Lachnospiraceae bacterium]